MNEILNQLVEQANVIVTDALKDSKAARRRIRKATLVIAKLGKEYRKASLAAEKEA